MHRFFIPQLYNETMTITGVDARHISKVLRMQPGDELQLVSDDGVSAIAEITAIDAESVSVRCKEKLAESHEPVVRLILAQGLAKGEKMDFIIQKAVEMGAYSVVPVAMEHSVVRLDGAKAQKRWSAGKRLPKRLPSKASVTSFPGCSRCRPWRRCWRPMSARRRLSPTNVRTKKPALGTSSSQGGRQSYQPAFDYRPGGRHQ